MTDASFDQVRLAEFIADEHPLMRHDYIREVSDSTASPPPKPKPKLIDTELPAHLLDVPGLVGHITRYFTKTALYPQPVLSLGAALAVVGTAAGRKYAGPTKSGTHLYVLGIAPTGAGKNHPPKQAKRLMRWAQMGDWVGPGQFMSEPAVYQIVAKKPQSLCFMDEFGSYLARINNPRSSSGYEKAISGVLRTLWGASFDTVEPPAWASNSTREKLETIYSPALSIYGMSVPEEFYQSLQGSDITNGFLNRFLILPTSSKPPEVDPEVDDDDEGLASSLIRHLQAIAERPMPKRTSMADPRELGAKFDIRVDWESSSARLIYRDFREEVQARAESAPLLSRVPEMAVRLATIRAIGRARDAATIAGPKVDDSDIRWGCELALWSGERMMRDADLYMVETEHQGQAKEVLRFVEEAGSLSLTDLNRKLKQRYRSNQIRTILEGLQEAGLIELQKVRSDVEGACRPVTMVRFTGGE